MRSDCRTVLRDLIASELPDATVLKYRKADPKGVSPLIMICSDGTSRGDPQRRTLEGTFPTHTLRVYNMVLHADPPSGWTEEMAEDLLDLQEDSISDVIDANQVTSAWKRIARNGPSQAERVEIGGVVYLLEVIMIDVMELK